MIPCYNEEKTLPLVVKEFPKKIEGINKIEVLVINDGSKDNSEKVAKDLGVHVYSHKTNRGLGQTFRDGIEEALRLGADIIVNIDGDNQFDSKDVARIAKPIIDGEADFVTASRYSDYEEHNSQGRGIKNFGNKMFAWLINKITGKNFSDVSCGMRGYSREVALKLRLFGHFTYTHETFLDIVHKNFTIKEVPVKVEPLRKEGKSKISGNLAKYGYSAIKIIVRGFRDHEPLRFFGYLGFLMFSISFFFGIILVIWYLYTGSFTPYKIFGFASAFFMAIGIVIIVLALLADMLGRIRDIEEEILFNQKNGIYNKKV